MKERENKKQREGEKEGQRERIKRDTASMSVEGIPGKQTRCERRRSRQKGRKKMERRGANERERKQTERERERGKDNPALTTIHPQKPPLAVCCSDSHQQQSDSNGVLLLPLLTSDKIAPQQSSAGCRYRAKGLVLKRPAISHTDVYLGAPPDLSTGALPSAARQQSAKECLRMTHRRKKHIIVSFNFIMEGLQRRFPVCVCVCVSLCVCVCVRERELKDRGEGES